MAGGIYPPCDDRWYRPGNPTFVCEVLVTKEERLERDGWNGIEPVLFYGANNPNGQGSNFSIHSVMLPHPFTGQLSFYKTGEHRYQAMKATNFEEHEFVRLTSTAFQSKEAGRAIKLRDGWGDDYGDLCWYVMLETIRGKTAQHVGIRTWLKRTDNRLIYEDSPTDDIWGWRFREDYRGKNLLGRCWMEVRKYV